MGNWIVLSSIALVLWGITGITQKLSTNNVSFERSFVWFGVAFFGIAVVILIATPLEWRISAAIFALAVVGGLLNGLGALTSFAALEKGGKASVVIPLISLYPLVTIAAARLFLGEKLNGRQIAGVFLALAAAALLAQEGKPADTSKSS